MASSASRTRTSTWSSLSIASSVGLQSSDEQLQHGQSVSLKIITANASARESPASASWSESRLRVSLFMQRPHRYTLRRHARTRELSVRSGNHQSVLICRLSAHVHNSSVPIATQPAVRPAEPKRRLLLASSYILRPLLSSHCWAHLEWPADRAVPHHCRLAPIRCRRRLAESCAL